MRNLGPLILSLLLLAAPARAGSGRERVAQISAAGMTQILAAPQLPGLGTSRPHVTVVEYMDYNCPYCRAMAPDFERLVKTDPGVRVLFKDWPIFGPISTYAARAALAAQYQGKYLIAHNALLATPEHLSSVTQIRATLQRAGISLTRLDADLKTHQAAIAAILARNGAEARGLGLEGTPGLVVGDLLVPGAIRFADLQKLISFVRNRTRPSSH